MDDIKSKSTNGFEVTRSYKIEKYEFRPKPL